MAIVIQLPERLVITLEAFHAEQVIAGQQTIALRTLKDQAVRGELPGAFKVGGRWWINKMALIQMGLQWGADGEKETAASEEGLGDRYPIREKPVASKEKAGGLPGRIRFSS